MSRLAEVATQLLEYRSMLALVRREWYFSCQHLDRILGPREETRARGHPLKFVRQGHQSCNHEHVARLGALLPWFTLLELLEAPLCLQITHIAMTAMNVVMMPNVKVNISLVDTKSYVSSSFCVKSEDEVHMVSWWELFSPAEYKTLNTQSNLLQVKCRGVMT